MDCHNHVEFPRGSRVKPAGGLGAGLLLPLALLWGEARAATREGTVPFKRIVIDQDPPDRPYFKLLGDINGDGFLDIIVAGAKGPLVWYKYPDWSKAELASGGWNGVRGAVGDVDGDGKVDVVLGGIVWFRNPGAAGPWSVHRIDTQRAHDVQLGDVDGDGRPDVVARDQSAFGKSGNAIYVYRQKGPDSWAKEVIPCPHGEGVRLIDLDGDGDRDIVIGGLWYENTHGDWREHRYTSEWQEPDAKVEVVDLNGDGRADIVLAPSELQGERYRVAWYEAPAEPKQEGWKEHTIVPDIETVVHSLAVGDFDGDGRSDVAIAEMHQGADPDEVSVFFNRGGGKSWRKQLLSSDGSHDIVAGDLGGDGDLDIVGANHAGASHPVELWQNERKTR